MMIHNFNDSLNAGKAGEKKVMKWLEGKSTVEKVVNFSEEGYYQGQGIDCVVHTKDKRFHNVEIKTDSYQKNFYFELENSGKRGCFLKSQADYWVYYFSNNNKIYTLPLKEVRNFITSIEEEDYEIYGIEKRVVQNTDFTSYGITIPAKMLAMHIKSIKEEQYEENLGWGF